MGSDLGASWRWSDLGGSGMGAAAVSQGGQSSRRLGAPSRTVLKLLCALVI